MKSMEISLIPISERKNEKNCCDIPLDKVEFFAYIASTLDPTDSFQRIDGYTNALWEYMQEKKYEEKELFFYYDKLIHANMGHSILCSLIELYLLEKEMRNEGISDTYIKQYQKLQNEYFYLLNQLKKEEPSSN